MYLQLPFIISSVFAYTNVITSLPLTYNPVLWSVSSANITVVLGTNSVIVSVNTLAGISSTVDSVPDLSGTNSSFLPVGEP